MIKQNDQTPRQLTIKTAATRGVHIGRSGKNNEENYLTRDCSTGRVKEAFCSL